MRTFKMKSTILVLLLALPLAPLAAQQPTVSLAGLSESFESISRQALPAIVQIFTRSVGVVQTAPGQTAVGLSRRSGSGVVVSPDGYIVTNNHVVEGARSLEVLLPEAAVASASDRSILKPVGKRVSARLVGTDLETDLAILKVDVSDHAFLALADSDELRPGQVVLAFGSPLGLQNSVTMGIISAVARQLRTEDRMIYIQTDAPVNPGNSGGPLVNIDGKVVGINTIILSQGGGSEGLGFAAPSNIVSHVYDQIRQYGRVRRGDIGVFAQTITPVMAQGLRLINEWGVILADVYPGGPADRAGLKPGDLIVSLNGKPMENGRQFDVNVYGKPIGQPVTIEVRRGLERLSFSVPVVERSDNQSRLADLVNEDSRIPALGILALPLDRQLASMLPGVTDLDGVVVASRALGSVPREDDLQPGDVVYSLNGEPTGSVPALRAAVARLQPGDGAVFHVSRGGRRYYVAYTWE